MRAFFASYWFLLGLGTILALGIVWPHELTPAAESLPQPALVALVMFLMALPLDVSHIWDAFRKPTAVLLAVVLNAVALPLLAWAVSFALPGDLSVGLMIAGSVPTTMASAAVWTRRAGGNDAIATLGTLITSLSCFVVSPLWLWLTTGQDVQLNLEKMILDLLLIVVLPTLIGQLLRLWPACAQWATRNKIPLSTAAQCGILAMVFIGAVKVGVQIDQNSAQLGLLAWTGMLTAVVFVHLAILWAGHAVGKLCGLSWGDRLAVGFSGSQKTLATGLTIALEYFPTLPLAMLPMVAFHICQLLVDALLAEQFRKHVPRDSASAALPAIPSSHPSPTEEVPSRTTTT